MALNFQKQVNTYFTFMIQHKLCHNLTTFSENSLEDEKKKSAFEKLVLTSFSEGF